MHTALRLVPYLWPLDPSSTNLQPILVLHAILPVLSPPLLPSKRRLSLLVCARFVHGSHSELTLSFNAISGSIPTELLQLPNIQYEHVAGRARFSLPL
jgi:hypothetical protein